MLRILAISSKTHFPILLYNNPTYKKVAVTFESDGTILGDIIKYFKSKFHELKDEFTFKPGSVYSLGRLTLNRNASLMGTYDLHAFGKTLLYNDSLVYFGNDVKVYAPSLDLIGGFKKKGWTGFKAQGDVYTTLKCTNKAKHPNGYTIYTKDYDPSKTYKCRCGATLSKDTVRYNVTSPVVVYANKDIELSTSTDMTLCYLVSCNGDVTISEPFYNESNNDSRNLYQLPNAIAAYNGNITYSSIYGRISALFYAPSSDVKRDENGNPIKDENGNLVKAGCIKFDGFYQGIWGSIIGDTVDIKTFYINIHRFENWRTMDLQIAEANKIYMISEEEYNKQQNNVDESYLHTGNNDDENKGGAYMFFDKDLVDKVEAANKGNTTG